MAGRSLIVLTLVCLAAILFWPVPEQPVASPDREMTPAAAAKLAVIPPGAPGTRIWYAANNYPHLSLPGGRQEIIRSALNIRGPMQFGSFVWDEDRIPKTGALWVRIDL